MPSRRENPVEQFLISQRGTAESLGEWAFYAAVLLIALALINTSPTGRSTADAEAAGVRLHVLIDARDGLLTGECIRAAVPEWREASIWFCGPAGFGEALRRDFAAQGVPVAERFHHELFAMR